MPPRQYDESARRDAILANVVVDGDCHVWQGLLDVNGYAITSWHGRRHRVHRLAWEWANGCPIPSGTEPDHVCRRRACINPVHLEAVTHRENVLRGRTIAARNAAKTHCISGHAFTPENTRIRRGARECRTCCRERQRRPRREAAA